MSGSDDKDGRNSRAPRTGPGSQRRRGGAAPPHSRSMTITAWVSIVVVSALVVATLAAYVKYREVWDSIHRVDVTANDLGRRPPNYPSATDTNELNLLVFASGSTSGLTRRQQLAWHVGSDDGDAVSETTMIVHISPGPPPGDGGEHPARHGRPDLCLRQGTGLARAAGRPGAPPTADCANPANETAARPVPIRRR